MSSTLPLSLSKSDAIGHDGGGSLHCAIAYAPKSLGGQTPARLAKKPFFGLL
jgi:hypothetical protein